MQEPQSKCCQATLTTHNGEEGTNCYICTNCRKPTDPQEPHQSTQAEILIKHYGQDWFIDVCKIIDETPDKVDLKRKLGDYISDHLLYQANTPHQPTQEEVTTVDFKRELYSKYDFPAELHQDEAEEVLGFIDKLHTQWVDEVRAEIVKIAKSEKDAFGTLHNQAIDRILSLPQLQKTEDK